MQSLRTRQASCFLVTALMFCVGAYDQAGGVLPSVLQYWPDVVYLTKQHLQLVAFSGGLAIAVGVPLGIVLTRERFRAWGAPVMQAVNLGTTIPTLAKFALAMTILGIGIPPAVFGLCVL